MDKTDAVAVIGESANVIKSVSTYNKQFAKEIAGFGGAGNPEHSQNPTGSSNPTEGNIIAIANFANKNFAGITKSTFEDAAAFNINHGAGHNSSLNHAGSQNGTDEKHENNLYVPGGTNVMTDGGTIVRDVSAGKTTLQSYITSPVNRQAANSNTYFRTISIQAMYLHRFGNNTPKASLPTE